MKWRYARPNTRVCTHTHTMYTNIYIQTQYTWVRDLRTHFFGTAMCMCALSAERERDTSPSGLYMNHVHYIIERELL